MAAPSASPTAPPIRQPRKFARVLAPRIFLASFTSHPHARTTRAPFWHSFRPPDPPGCGTFSGPAGWAGSHVHGDSMSTKKFRVGVLGATGMVGQRFLSLLENHPWYEITLVAASANSAGQKYSDAVKGRWALASPPPAKAGALVVQNASDVARIADQVDLVFCAVDMSKEETAKLEEDYARRETPVVSNNSAHRATPDVPMMVPEVNPEHASVIEAQRRRLGTRRGFVAVKPNCSLQSYVPAIHPLMKFGPKRVAVC